MKINTLMKILSEIQREYGDIEVQVQNSPALGEQIVGYSSFFIVPEDYEEETIVNIRTWPY